MTTNTGRGALGCESCGADISDRGRFARFCVRHAPPRHLPVSRGFLTVWESNSSPD